LIKIKAALIQETDNSEGISHGGMIMANEAKQETRGQDVQKVTPAHMLSPFDEMDRMFDGFFRRGMMRPWRIDWPAFPEMASPEMRMPKVDLVDRENEVFIRAEVPGVDKKDLDISVGDNSVTIKGSTRHEEQEEKGDYFRCEISRGTFSRTVALPTAVDSTRAKAEFRDGLLELTLPKLEKAKRHSVKID
jgi:HSP20 family protein